MQLLPRSLVDQVLSLFIAMGPKLIHKFIVVDDPIAICVDTNHELVYLSRSKTETELSDAISKL